MILRLVAGLAGALLLAWPAFLNGYPLLFSDTGAFLHQTAPAPSGPLVIWDKPHIYGPLLHLFHWRVSLWGPMLAQALALSHLLWLAQRGLRGVATPGTHLLACAGAALLTTAPFTIALLMPDVFAPIVLLALLLLGFVPLSRMETAWLVLLAAVGIAAHLSHLPLALAVVVFVVMVARRIGPVLRAAAPMALAVLLLLGTNLWGHGRATLSPHGATFALARLQADGPAAALVRARCPEAGWYLCAFADRLPMDSDAFLWEPDSPVNRAPDGAPRFLGGALLSEEARVIVAETLRAYPLEVARTTVLNALRQVVLATAGDTLVDTHLATAVRPRIAEGFPAGELAAYDGALQPRGLLPTATAPFLWPHAPVLLVGAVLALYAWWRLRGDVRRIGLVVGVLVGVSANALATGGLSKPHLRYEARILWLMPVIAGLALLPRSRPVQSGAYRAGVM
ncbi:hypothetical protein ACLF3G_09575 [Falsiroseomonas sp. HC035]|uniref:hypothetical protein n=1 Tax=Falsiroseomonas sp. HC035 TaxID=3390999 RepID=UPI003D31EB4A